MGKTMLAGMLVLAAAAACGKSGGDSKVVDCNRLRTKVSNCLTELTMGQIGSDPTGETPSGALMNVLGGRIGSECPERAGKLDDAPAINACLGKSGCQEMADCFRGLAP